MNEFISDNENEISIDISKEDNFNKIDKNDNKFIKDQSKLDKNYSKTNINEKEKEENNNNDDLLNNVNNDKENNNKKDDNINVSKENSNETLNKNKDNDKSQQKLMDRIIEESGYNSYNLKIFIVLALFFLADGGEMVVISLIVSELEVIWDLSSGQKGFIGSAVFIGFYFGALVGGKISDSKGRKPTFILGAFIVLIFGVLSSFAPSYWFLVIMRCLFGCGVGIAVPASTSLLTELTPFRSRSCVLTMVWFSFPIGEIFAVVFAKNVLSYDDGWRYLLFIVAFPALISIIISGFMIESPRYYYVRGHYDKAADSLDLILLSLNKPKLTAEQRILLANQGNLDRGNNPVPNQKIEDDEIPVDNIHELSARINTIEEKIYKNDLAFKSLNNINQKDVREIKIDNVDQIEVKDNNMNNNNNNNNNNNDNNKVKIINTLDDNINKYDSELENNPDKSPKDKHGEVMKVVSNKNNNSIDKKGIDNTNKKVQFKKGTFGDLFKKSSKLLTLSICFIFFTASFVYYGIVYILPQNLNYIAVRSEVKEFLLNNTSNFTITNIYAPSYNTTDLETIDYEDSNLIDTLSTNKLFLKNEINREKSDDAEVLNGLFLSIILELPSNVLSIYLANHPKLGRIKTMAIGFTITTLFAVLSIIFIEYIFVFAAILKFSISIPFAVIYIYTCEAYPTNIRSIAIGFSNSFNRLAGILTPIFSQIFFNLKTYMPYFSYMILSILAGFTSLNLPFETLGRKLEDV